MSIRIVALHSLSALKMKIWEKGGRGEGGGGNFSFPYPHSKIKFMIPPSAEAKAAQSAKMKAFSLFLFSLTLSLFVQSKQLSEFHLNKKSLWIKCFNCFHIQNTNFRWWMPNENSSALLFDHRTVFPTKQVKYVGQPYNNKLSLKKD